MTPSLSTLKLTEFFPDCRWMMSPSSRGCQGRASRGGRSGLHLFQMPVARQRGHVDARDTTYSDVVEGQGSDQEYRAGLTREIGSREITPLTIERDAQFRPAPGIGELYVYIAAIDVLLEALRRLLGPENSGHGMVALAETIDQFVANVALRRSLSAGRRRHGTLG